MKYAWILLMCLLPSAWGQEGATATVRGELLLADGSPAVGASVVLSLEILRSAENGGRPARTMPNHASALVGADGSFLLSCSAESVGIYELEASLGAQDIKSWTWIGMEAGRRKTSAAVPSRRGVLWKATWRPGTERSWSRAGRCWVFTSSSRSSAARRRAIALM